jgi:hypothetical protein
LPKQAVLFTPIEKSRFGACEGFKRWPMESHSFPVFFPFRPSNFNGHGKNFSGKVGRSKRNADLARLFRRVNEYLPAWQGCASLSGSAELRVQDLPDAFRIHRGNDLHEIWKKNHGGFSRTAGNCQQGEKNINKNHGISPPSWPSSLAYSWQWEGKRVRQQIVKGKEED